MIYINVIAISFVILFAGTVIYSKFINTAGCLIRNRYFIVVLPHIILINSYIVSIIYGKMKNNKILKLAFVWSIIADIIYMIIISYFLGICYPNIEGDGFYKRRVDYLIEQEDIYDDSTLIICTFGKAWVKYYFTDSGLQLPQNIIVVDPLKYPNTEHMSAEDLANFEYCVKDGKIVENEAVEDLSQYDIIYYMPTYRCISEETSKKIEEDFKVDLIDDQLEFDKLERITE
jgi:hypothetical protein